MNGWENLGNIHKLEEARSEAGPKKVSVSSKDNFGKHYLKIGAVGLYQILHKYSQRLAKTDREKNFKKNMHSFEENCNKETKPRGANALAYQLVQSGKTHETCVYEEHTHLSNKSAQRGARAQGLKTAASVGRKSVQRKVRP